MRCGRTGDSDRPAQTRRKSGRERNPEGCLQKVEVSPGVCGTGFTPAEKSSVEEKVGLKNRGTATVKKPFGKCFSTRRVPAPRASVQLGSRSTATATTAPPSPTSTFHPSVVGLLSPFSLLASRITTDDHHNNVPNLPIISNLGIQTARALPVTAPRLPTVNMSGSSKCKSSRPHPPLTSQISSQPLPRDLHATAADADGDSLWTIVTSHLTSQGPMRPSRI